LGRRWKRGIKIVQTTEKKKKRGARKEEKALGQRGSEGTLLNVRNVILLHSRRIKEEKGIGEEVQRKRGGERKKAGGRKPTGKRAKQVFLGQEYQ